MKPRQLLKFSCLLLFLASCASRYAPQGEDGYGYSNQRVSENIFDIHYQGNNETSLSDARKYAYRRAAELTLASGYTHFSILEEQEVHSFAPSPLSDPINTFTATNGKIENPEYPGVHLTIYCSYASDLKAGIDARKWMSKRTH